MSDNILNVNLSDDDLQVVEGSVKDQNNSEKMNSEKKGSSNSEKISLENQSDSKKRKSASPEHREENKRMVNSRSVGSPRPSSSRRRSPSRNRTPPRRTSSASGTSSNRTSRRPAGLYASQTKKGKKEPLPPKDDRPNKYYMDYSVYNVDYPKDMPSGLNLDEEDHYVFMATDWPQDLIEQAEGLKYCCRPDATIDEIADEIIDVIDNRDVTKRLYITAPIFEKFLTTLLPEGIEKVVDRISAHIKNPREEWLKTRTPTATNIFKVYLTYPTIPYRPSLEHYWPEICEANQLLKNESISLYSTPVNFNKWLCKTYAKDVRQREVLANMYTEYAETRTGLGYTLTHNAQRKINSAIISHHVTGVRAYRAGSLVIETPPVPLDLTSGYKITTRNRTNGWIQPIMGAMWAQLKLRDDEREFKIEQAEAKKKAEREQDEARRAERKQEQEKAKKKAEQERAEKEKPKDDFQKRLARISYCLSPSIVHPDSLEALIDERDKVIKQMKHDYATKSEKLRIVSAELLEVNKKAEEIQAKRVEEMDTYTEVLERYDANTKKAVEKAQEQQDTIHCQDKQLRRDSATIIHLREKEIRQDKVLESLKAQLASVQQELKVEKELTAALQKQKAKAEKKGGNKEAEEK